MSIRPIFRIGDLLYREQVSVLSNILSLTVYLKMDDMVPLIFENEDDEQAKSFDQNCYSIQLELLQKGSPSAGLVDETFGIAGALNKRGPSPWSAPR